MYTYLLADILYVYYRKYLLHFCDVKKIIYLSYSQIGNSERINESDNKNKEVGEKFEQEKSTTIKTYMHTKWFEYLYPTLVVYSKVLI